MRADATSPSRRLALTALLGRLAVRELVRSRAALGLGAASLGLLAVLGLAAHQGLDAARATGGTLNEDATGATLAGTSGFVVLLLGGVVAVASAQGAIRGDAARGLLAHVLARPVPRGVLLDARTLAATSLAAGYVVTTWCLVVAVIRLAGGWAPPRWLLAGLALALGAALLAVATVALSTLLESLAAGSAALALLGLGFTAGLLAQFGTGLDLPALLHVADAMSLALPFEALYRWTLHLLTPFGDLSRFGVVAGPFGGARAAEPWHAAWLAGWVVVVLGAARVAVARQDLA